MKKDYFDNELNNVEEEFLSADGDDWNFDDDVYVDASEDDMYAGGGGVQPPTSDPFIVTLYNSTDAAISNVDFLYAAASIGGTNNGVTAGITVSYDVPNITYAMFLYSLLTQSVKIAEMYIECATTSQLTKVIKLDTGNVRGSGGYRLITPRVNPFQNQTTNLVASKIFYMNGFTQLTLATLAAYTSVTFSFYPIMQSSSINQIQKPGKGGQSFSSPQIDGMKILDKKRLSR